MVGNCNGDVSSKFWKEVIQVRSKNVWIESMESPVLEATPRIDWNQLYRSKLPREDQFKSLDRHAGRQADDK